MPATATTHVSAEDYLAAERAADSKHELWRGEVFAMAGASFTHNRLVANLLAELRSSLPPECVELPSDLNRRSNSTRPAGPPAQRAGRVATVCGMKVHVPSRDAFVYPDASVVCGPPSFFDATQDVLRNPSAVFEVLSDSTERFDRGEKFVGYRSVPSLREFVLISQHERRVEHYVRRDDGRWVLHDQADDGAVLLACGGTLTLAGLYRGVEL